MLHVRGNSPMKVAGEFVIKYKFMVSCYLAVINLKYFWLGHNPENMQQELQLMFNFSPPSGLRLRRN